MVEIKKYQVLEIGIESASTFNYIKLWNKSIASLIKSISNEFTLSLLTPNPNRKSIGYDIGKLQCEGKYNSIRYLITTIKDPTSEDIEMLISSDEFYLGLTVLVIGEVQKSKIQNLLLLWNKELVKSELEFLKMDSDGLCFYWYNPKSNDVAKGYFESLRLSIT